MKLKDYSILILLILTWSISYAQSYQISGTVSDNITGTAIENVAIYDKNAGQLAITDINGKYRFETTQKELTLIWFSYEYVVLEESLTINNDLIKNVQLQQLGEELTAIELTVRKEKLFQLERLKDVEGTSIYAGKKTEVVLIENSTANLAANNARQIFNQVAGLNIYQNDDAGLQLNIGGRGLDPNRTANFNTRQNRYDISADVLGYPESYYAPPAEGLQSIQVIRGAASLQYGTQFGGLVNFVMKEPNQSKPLELITRNTIGSNGLYTNFTSLSGTSGKWSYYTFFNYKKGDGFRPNSQFESKNIYAHVGYQFNDQTKVTGEITYLNYLAQQAGGLNDRQFEENPFQSNRERNWFEVDWFLYNLNFSHDFTEDTKFTFNAFGLQAQRNALGFRTNRVDQIDPGTERDLIKGDFNNYGAEARFLSTYNLAGKKNIFLIGSKFYKANNTSTQGPGSDGSDADFDFRFDEYPNYSNQNDFVYPNLNISLFGENIFYVNDKISFTPGFRLEYIKTESEGFTREIRTDAAGNVIFNEVIDESRSNERTFALLGLGTSYKANDAIELYGNISQNYRSVTFTDISTINPAFEIDPNIDDEKGFTADIGARGNFNDFISYDASAFALFYNDRIGFTQVVADDGRVKSQRGNVGDAVIYGLESLVDLNLQKLLIKNRAYKFNLFFNTSLVSSEYTNSDANGIEGNKVEFIPELNFKTGFQLGYKNFMSSIQYSYLSQQFTDATNATDGNLSGVIGAIPAYDVLDFSASYKYNRFKLEAGINNVLDNSYFTRRATGYPGPGIITSPNRNYYITLEIKI
ncbi:TonB-dependent receptor domain-containing protein [Nonlabens sp. Asnod3-H03]|uniref:TonB-dependent receptor domain-containing protein n=1 Tax=Nonlabens sp. Asnod3-H03 TaxID=3160580 RepID=UPI00386C1D0E